MKNTLFALIALIALLVLAAPAEAAPTATFTKSASSIQAHQNVTLTWTGSCDSAPCTYAWKDVGSDGPGGTDYALGNGTPQSGTTSPAFKLDTYFNGTGTKYPQLTVTNSRGSVAKSCSTKTACSAASNLITVTADTTPPNTTITSAPPASTEATTASFAFTGTQSPGEPVPTFECRLDGAAYAACTSPKSYSGLATGSHTFNVRAKDSTGNVDASPAAYTWSVTAPASGPALGTLLWNGDALSTVVPPWEKISNSGSASSVASTAFAHTGTYSVKQVTDTSAGQSGTRLERNPEIRQHSDLVYGAWIYEPANFQVNTSSGFYNLIQFKAYFPDIAAGSQVVWAVYVRNDPATGKMYARLTDKSERWTTGVTVDHDQSIKEIPVGQWTHFQVRYRTATDNTGGITVWQDGVQLFDFQGVKTTWACSDCSDPVPGQPSFMVNAYGSVLTPSIVTQYVDDASINLPG